MVALACICRTDQDTCLACDHARATLVLPVATPGLWDVFQVTPTGEELVAIVSLDEFKAGCREREEYGEFSERDHEIDYTYGIGLGGEGFAPTVLYQAREQHDDNMEHHEKVGDAMAKNGTEIWEWK